MITSYDDPRIDLARTVLGAVSVRPEPGLPTRLLHLADTRGNGYFAKQHQHPNRFAQEIRAYTSWTHHLGAATPGLVAHHEASLTLLLTEAPGQPVETLQPGSDEQLDAYRAAGAALRALHASTLTPGDPQLGHRLGERLLGWTVRADQAGLISPAARAYLLAAATDLQESEPQGAICHLDYQPRNWRWASPNLAVVDFEHMRPDARLRDLARLYHRLWPTAPHLEAAFHHGYGDLSDADHALLCTFGAYEAATALVRGHETGNAELHAHGSTLLDRLM